MSEPVVSNTQWKYLIIEDNDVTGTNNMKVVQEFAGTDSILVIDTTTCKIISIVWSGELKAYNIEEQQTYDFGD